MTDRDFTFAGLAWLGVAWAMGIAALLWDARRKRTSAGTDAGSGTGSQSRHPAATSAVTEAARVLPRLRARLATGGDDAPELVKPATTEVHLADATTGPGAGARVGARPAFVDRESRRGVVNTRHRPWTAAVSEGGDRRVAPPSGGWAKAESHEAGQSLESAGVRLPHDPQEQKQGGFL